MWRYGGRGICEGQDRLGAQFSLRAGPCLQFLIDHSHPALNRTDNASSATVSGSCAGAALSYVAG
jgi:hypothetical protein